MSDVNNGSDKQIPFGVISQTAKRQITGPWTTDQEEEFSSQDLFASQPVNRTARNPNDICGPATASQIGMRFGYIAARNADTIKLESSFTPVNHEDLPHPKKLLNRKRSRKKKDERISSTTVNGVDQFLRQLKVKGAKNEKTRLLDVPSVEEAVTENPLTSRPDPFNTVCIKRQSLVNAERGEFVSESPQNRVPAVFGNCGRTPNTSSFPANISSSDFQEQNNTEDIPNIFSKGKDTSYRYLNDETSKLPQTPSANDFSPRTRLSDSGGLDTWFGEYWKRFKQHQRFLEEE